MVKSKKVVKKEKVVNKNKKVKKKEEVEEEESKGGMGLDDALAGLDEDEDMKSAESKPRKVKKKDLDDEIDEAEDEVEEVSKAINGGEPIEPAAIKASKPVEKIKKGDIMYVDGMKVEVDSHYVLIDHGRTKEMAIEIFDPKTDKDYQLRYFSDQIATSLEFYELQEIIYVKRAAKLVSW